jgi:hypothetical protein
MNLICSPQDLHVGATFILLPPRCHRHKTKPNGRIDRNGFETMVRSFVIPHVVSKPCVRALSATEIQRVGNMRRFNVEFDEDVSVLKG